MKFVIAPDKYKGSLTGIEFCNAAEIGIKKVFPNAEIIKKPLADGGDGTMEAVKNYLSAKEVTVKVSDPLFRKIDATYLYSEKNRAAFIEMSEASGYRLLRKAELNCMNTTTLGTGELIVDALNKGAEEIVLGIGGSATNDGGMGVAHALGYRFLDAKGNVLEPIGKNLGAVAEIDSSRANKNLRKVKVRVACDVENPFYGKDGAAYVYAPQKGASNEEVALLDKGLKSFAAVLKTHFKKDISTKPAAGAAGGLGGGAMLFLDATLISGINYILEISDFNTSIKNAHWIITGEGKIDSQTLSGKTIAGLLESAKKNSIDVAAFCGVVGLSLEEQEALGLTYCTSILKDFQNLDEAKRSSFENLVYATYNFCNALKRSTP